MALGRPLSPLTLVPAERQRLLEWTRLPLRRRRHWPCARIVLLCAETAPDSGHPPGTQTDVLLASD